MQDQGKRLLLAVALALGVMMLWQVIFPPKKAPPKPPQTAGSGSEAIPQSFDPYDQPAPVAGSGSAGSGSAATPVPVAAPKVVLEGYGVKLELVPPFRIARATGPKAKSDEMVVVHQDGAGADKDRQLRIIPSAIVGGGAVPALRPVTRPGPGYQVGDKGTVILLGPNMIDARGVAVIESGRGDAPWTIAAGAEVAPWAAGVECTSTATAPGYECRDPDAAVAAGSGSAGGGSGSAAGSGAGSSGPVVAEPTTPTPTPPVAAPRPDEITKTFTFDDVKVVTSSYGGVIKQWKLLASKYERDHYKGEMVPAQGGGALLVYFPGSTYTIPRDAVWTPSAETENSITYTWSAPELTVAKTFTIWPEDFLLHTQIVITPTDKTVNAQQVLAVRTAGFQDPNASTAHARGNTEWKAACLRGEVRIASSKTLAQRPAMENGVRWAGFTNGYVPGGTLSSAQAGQFLVATSPHQGANELIACNAYGSPQVKGLMQVDLQYQPAQLKAGDPPLVRELVSYLGPSSYELLERADARAGYSTGFKEVPDFGWFGVIGRPLLWLLHKFFDLVGNWGIAIVLLTILVKLATIYFTTRSMRSMKAMAALTPKMKELQEKHKNDRAKLQQETMAMYKQYGVNPLAGCLPILLQMPIWIALYRMLSAAGELYLEPLIPGWISDLTSTDPYHILPIVLIVTMFGQAKLQPQTQTGFQQKLIMYGIPLMFGVASFFFPSGLSLYIVTNTILSALHSIYMNKYDKKGKAIVAAISKQVGSSGGGGGGSGGGKGGGKSDGKAGGERKPKAAARPAIEVEDRSAKALAAKSSAEDDDGDDDGDESEASGARAGDRDDDDDDDGDESEESGARVEASAEGAEEDDAGGNGGDDGDDAGPAAGGATQTTGAQRTRRASRARRKRRGRN